MGSILIVGTGLAGYTLAREIRKLNPQLPLELISSDDGRSYSKPMLSNALTKGKTADQLANASARQMAEQLKAPVHVHTTVNSIDNVTRSVTTNRGTFGCDRLVLALGADPIRLAMPGTRSDDVVSINDLNDYARFRARLKNHQHILILGAGLIGCEFANDLINTGYKVTVVDPAELPLGRLVPESSGTHIRGMLQAEGINWKLGSTANRIDRSGNGFAITLSSGEELQADHVLSAVGLRPRTSLAEQAGLSCNRGIQVNRSLETSNATIYALGDCAEVCGLVLPFVMPIMHAARALARTLTGDPTQVIYPSMPVVVKTPACPAVVAPPPAGCDGAWSTEKQDNGGTIARFTLPDGNLAGFALTGSGTIEKQVLSKQLPPLLA